MMREHLNHIRRTAQLADQMQSTTLIGVISGYEPSTYSAKVILKPENIETGWLPIESAWVGNNWGLHCPPTIGDLVHVEFHGGNLDAGMIIGRLYNDKARPLPVQSGEYWLVHALGAFVKLTNDGKLLINGQLEIDVTAPTLNITISGNANVSVGGNITSSAAAWNHTGNVNVTGTVTASTDVIGGGKSLKTHVHSGVTTGVSVTGTPV